MRRSDLRPPLWLPALALLAATSACGGSEGPRVPDYSEWLHAGVDPRAEAQALSEGLARAGFRETRRIEGERWVALEARTEDDRRAIRVVTRIGAALVLDSHDDRGLAVRHGAIELAVPPLPEGHDLDRDGLDEIVVGARIDDRTCLLPFRVQEDDTVLPVPPDLGALEGDTCVERLEDVDGDGRLDGVAVVRFRDLARRDVPSIEVPLMLDLQARMRAGPPPIAWTAEQRGIRTRALQTARAARELDTVLRLAIELAALASTENASTETQLGIFDRAIAGMVWTIDLAGDVVAARRLIDAGWSPARPDPDPPLPRAP